MLPCTWCSPAAYKQPPGHGTRCNHNGPELLQQRPAGCCWAAAKAAAAALLSCVTLPHVPRPNSHGCSCGRHTLDCWAAPAAQQRAALQLQSTASCSCAPSSSTAMLGLWVLCGAAQCASPDRAAPAAFLLHAKRASSCPATQQHRAPQVMMGALEVTSPCCLHQDP